MYKEDIIKGKDYAKGGCYEKEEAVGGYYRREG